MGKIRVKTFGDEELEKKQDKKAQARADAKKAAEAAKKAAAEKQQASEGPRGAAEERSAADETQSPAVEKAETKAEPEKKTSAKGRSASGGKKSKFDVKKKQKHSANYLKTAANVDRLKKYNLTEALEILPKLQRAKFDETVELHINTVEKGISGNLVLPHGTGKQTRVAIANQSEDPKGVDELLKKIEAGQIDFDVLIATPDTMAKLARAARILGPRGLMPNPKNGTVSANPSEVAKKFEGGQINFKTEAKFPLLHMTVGKLSFGDKKLNENIKAALNAVKIKNVKTLTVKSTMSPGLKIDVSSL